MQGLSENTDKTMFFCFASGILGMFGTFYKWFRMSENT